MARQITDLPTMSLEDLAQDDLLVVRDKDLKKDKKLPVGYIKNAIELAQEIDSITDEGRYMIVKKDGLIEVSKYPEPFKGFTKFICKTSGGRSSSSSGTSVAVGSMFTVTNEEDQDIRVCVMATGMIQPNSSGVGRFWLSPSGSPGTVLGRMAYPNGIASDAGWREVTIHNSVLVPANSSVDLRCYIRRDGGSSAVTICDQPGDEGAGYGLHVSVLFEGYVEDED